MEVHPRSCLQCGKFSGNDRNYSNDTYDKLLDDASGKYANDPQKRWEALIAAEKEMMENTAV